MFAVLKCQSRFLASLLVVAALGLTQERGTIRGTVTDESGGAVPGATIRVTNPATGVSQIVKTGSDGIFNVLYLPVGTYTLDTEMAGFRKAQTTGITVNVNSVADLAIRLSVGSVDQAIEVTASSTLLETQGTNLGKVMPTKAINDLPLFITGGVRSTTAFVVLTPGVVGSGNNARIGGGLANSTSAQLDGAETQAERRLANGTGGISVEAIEEFKVQTGIYSAEFGRTGNGILNYVSKSGTNELHGSAFVFNRNEFFNARGYTFTPTKRAVLRQWNPGVSVGGPVFIPKVFDGRNKMFFFFAHEQSMNQTGRSTNLVTVPINEFRIGDMRKLVTASGAQVPLYDPFDASGNIITDPTQRQRMQCNGVLNVICPNRIDPAAHASMALLPQPDDPTRITQNTQSFSSTESKSYVPSIKVDYNATSKHRVNFLFGRNWTPALPNISAIQGVPPGNWRTSNLDRFYRLSEDYIISPSLLSHFTIGVNRNRNIENPGNNNGISQEWADKVRIPGLLQSPREGKATRYVTSYVQFGTHVDTDSRPRTVNVKEQLAWIKGRQAIKFGFEYLSGIYRRIDCNDCFASIAYSAQATQNPSVAGTQGSDWASFLLGTAQSSAMGYGGDFAYQWKYFAWYVQDDFKVNSKLTLNLGLRYDLPFAKRERALKNSNLDLAAPNPAAGGIPGAMVFAGDGPGRSGLTRFQNGRKNGWGPRLGLAYQLTPDTVLRTGGSIFYQGIREDVNADRGTQGFGGVFYSPTDYLGLGVSYLVKNGFNTFTQEVKANQPPSLNPGIVLFGAPFHVDSTSGRAPMFSDWQFTLEHRLTSTALVRGTYHGNVGIKLLSREQSLNQLDPKYIPVYGNLLNQQLRNVISNPVLAANGFKMPWASYPMTRTLSQALRPYPQYDNIDSSAGSHNDGHSTYHALELSMEERFGHGLYLLASYTFCKLITNADGDKVLNNGSGPAQNTYDVAAEKAVGAQDTTHNLRVSYVYDIPIGRGQKFLGTMPKVANAVVGNWKVSGIHTYVSGAPLGPIRSNQQMYGAAGIVPVGDGSAVAGALSTRAHMAPGAGTTIPLINPSWSSDPKVAWAVPYLNPAAFVYPAAGQYGNSPYKLSVLRGRWTINEDFAIFKSLHITEKRFFELRASAANVLNRVAFANPGTSMDTNTFGFITQPQGNSPRTIQMGLKLYF